MFNLLCNCTGKGQALPVEGFGQTRDVKNPEQFTASWVPDGGGRASPLLDFTTEVLNPLELDRL